MALKLLLLIFVAASVKAQNSQFQVSFVTEQMNQYCDLRGGASSGGFQPPTPTQPRVGKAGPRGERGPSGDVDYARIESLVEDKIIEVLGQTATQDDLALYQRIKAGVCKLEYQGRCFWSIIVPIDVHQGRALCQSVGGNAANIYDETHFGLIGQYLGLVAKGQDYIITGMDYKTGIDRSYDPFGPLTTTSPSGRRFQPDWPFRPFGSLPTTPPSTPPPTPFSTQKPTLSNGTLAPYVKWYKGRPSRSRGKTAITIFVQNDDNSNIMRNVDPEDKAAGVLCEI